MSGLEGLLAGRTLVGRYRIEEVIGRGGFAAVYRATDERLGRRVAVKVITLPAPDPDAREQLHRRFQREARAAASLPHHPNVVAVHDFGTDPELRIDFLVMELLHGEDLATFLARQGRPPTDLALRILRDAAEGLAVGHREGLVHRDVKPGNIFLAEPHDQDPFRVCVLDFGIARIAASDEDLTRLTHGGLPHSPAYASPEQLRGERDLTPASDVYSLGLVAYQLLTGEKAFGPERASDPAAAAPLERVRRLGPEVPREVRAVVERALAADPADRFASAAVMAAALDAATVEATRAAPAVAAAPRAEPEDHTLLQPAPTPPPPRPARRRPGAAVWALVLVVVAGAAFAALRTLGGGKGEAPPWETPGLQQELEEDLRAAETDTDTEGEAEDGAVDVAARPGAPPAAGESVPAGVLPVVAGVTGDSVAAGDSVLATPPPRQPPLPAADSLVPDSAARPDSVRPPPADSARRPPPRLLGTPVVPPRRTPPDTAVRDTAASAASRVRARRG